MDDIPSKRTDDPILNTREVIYAALGARDRLSPEQAAFVDAHVRNVMDNVTALAEIVADAYGVVAHTWDRPDQNEAHFTAHGDEPDAAEDRALDELAEMEGAL